MAACLELCYSPHVVHAYMCKCIPDCHYIRVCECFKQNKINDLLKPTTYIYIYIYVYVYVYMCMYVCIYVYIYRERERGRDSQTDKNTPRVKEHPTAPLAVR